MKPFTTIATIIFGVIALLHVLRLLFGGVVMIGRFEIPMWASFVGLMVTAVLCWGLWKERK